MRAAEQGGWGVLGKSYQICACACCAGTEMCINYSACAFVIEALVVGLCDKVVVAVAHRGGFCEKNLEDAPF